MTSSRIPQHRGRYSLEEMDGESLVYRQPSKQGVYLNETATVVWKLCDGTRNVQQIIDILVETYPDAADDIRSDVADTIDELVRIGCLKMVDPQDAPAAAGDGAVSTQSG